MPAAFLALLGSSTTKASIGAAAEVAFAAIPGRRIAQGVIAHTAGRICV
ncbi:MAG: hypothetical protein IID05_12170 [Gemmatimonadetes bacterium]|nr:hypothetical protein [Gemmatimonadota bacterium]